MTNENSISKLECGSSLAEREFASECQQEERQQQETLNNSQLPTSASCEEMINSIRDEIANDIVSNGNVQMFSSPFETAATHASVGQTNIPEDERYVKVPLVYCDQTASNRALVSIEQYIHNKCLPLYGNTHTNTSITGSQSTAFVAEARQIVAEGCNAKITGKASQDVVLFAGNGATSTVELLIDCLGIKAIANSETKPVVFIGPYEHHSNLVPWRESGCEIVMIPEDSIHGNVDIQELEKKLKLPEYKGNRLRMGAFSAASNVTGLVSDVNVIAATLHRHNALCFFDYATGAPYLPIDMNPPAFGQYSSGEIAKDAIFISPHKMIGGVSTPGILVVKKHLVNQTIAPNRSGGGTVFYVTHKHHRFLSNRIERFEGGTPDVIGILRAGLTFLAKRKISKKYHLAVSSQDAEMEGRVPKSIESFEYKTFQDIIARLKQSSPNLIILGTASEIDRKMNHLPIFSFLIKCGDRFLHYNYVCAILNDLFGIQSRGGCMCSGPYSQRLLGLTTSRNGEEVPNEVNERIEYALLHFKERSELLRPGFTRLSLPFKGCRSGEVEYVIRALEWVSKNAWVFMCQYRCNHRTGEWRHFSRQGKPLGRSQRRWLSHFELSYCHKGEQESLFSNVDEALSEAFKNAEYQLKVARTNPLYTSQALKMTDENQVLDMDDELDKLRWYVYPRECAIQVKRGAEVFPDTYSKQLQGGICPLGFFPALNIHFDSPLPYVEPLNKTDEIISIPDTGEAIALDPSDEITSYHFQDGENHSGEAHVDDIITGYHDQELSENCLIYIPNLDEWVSISVFIKQKMNSAKSHGENRDEIATTSYQMPKQDVSREYKKPSRDRSEWGKITSVDMPQVKRLINSNSTSLKESMDMNENRKQENAGKRKMNQNHAKPPAKLMKYITQAVIQWDMIKDGDRLLLGLSGGKDSMSLLHCLLELKRKLPQSFEIEVCTVDPMTPSFDPSPLIPYVQSLGLKYHYIRDNIVDRANSCGKNGEVVKSLCAFCARMKRGNLYTCARENNCNKLVLAQHLDDCAESCFMSIFHNGLIRSK